ncbi:MarR family winged helix-turn-helix transcriptional regulator [Jiangella sp. DSM 45060]|uniref:MarR family winged helix-turn-helix transcriptional regulator n=1 Tax=Jiangella sp. DSM 45060 TaxID=1798224 RepID=UPI00087C1C50|nr:hypothetical protein [Jiangella sp. DSM 45060]SDT68204.1 hypothetical protein SAMN04515669_5835 [Jiangella sp. DSM 45060]
MIITPLVGVDIGAAAKAIHSLLGVVLDTKGVTLAEWVALRTLGTAPDRVSQPSLRDGLVLALDIDPIEATAVLCSLEERGLLAYDRFEQIGLTADGRAQYDDLYASVVGVTAQVYAGIDTAELATTRRVLATVAARATELRAEF